MPVTLAKKNDRNLPYDTPSPAHPILLIHFTWKKDHLTACCPSYVCTYVFWLSWHLWRVKDYVLLGRQMLLLHSFGIVMKCCATLARDNFKWFLFDVVEIDFCYWISVRIHTHIFSKKSWMLIQDFLAFMKNALRFMMHKIDLLKVKYTIPFF